MCDSWGAGGVARCAGATRVRPAGVARRVIFRRSRVHISGPHVAPAVILGGSDTSGRCFVAWYGRGSAVPTFMLPIKFSRCTQASPARNPISPFASIVHTAALDSLMLTDRQGCAFAFSRQLSASMHVQLHAQPRVKHARLKMRCQGWRSARHVHVSVRLCATRGTGERTTGGDKDSIGDGRMWFRTWFVCKL